MYTRSLSSTLDRMLTLNRAFDEAFSTTSSGANRNGSHIWVPALDVLEQKDAYVIAAELPGIEESKIELGFEQNVLTIRGTKPGSADASKGEVRVHAAERVSGTFERTIRLPELIDGEHISATFVDGLLTVTVPKAKTAQARKIAINTAAEDAVV